MGDDIIILTESRPNRADAVKNRALLLETAERLFAEQGVDAVSMSAVAEAAGVGKGTLYRHFRDKGELCMSLLDRDSRDLQERVLRHLREEPDPRENLRWFLGEVAAFSIRNRQWLLIGSNVASVTALEHPAHVWWRMTIRGLLDRLNAQGDRENLANVLYMMLSVYALDFQIDVLGYDLERIQQALWETMDRLTA